MKAREVIRRLEEDTGVKLDVRRLQRYVVEGQFPCTRVNGRINMMENEYRKLRLTVCMIEPSLLLEEVNYMVNHRYGRGMVKKFVEKRERFNDWIREEMI